MSTKKRRLSHNALVVRLTTSVAEFLGNLQLGFPQEVDDAVAPSLYVSRIHFNLPATLTTSEHCCFEETVSEVAQMNKRLLNDIFRELLPKKGDAKRGHAVANSYLSAISGIDFPEVDGIHASGTPFVNTLMLVPDRLQGPLEDWVSRRSASSEASSIPGGAWVTGFEKLGSSEAAITRASDHVTSFIRAWAPIAGRDDIKEKFLPLFTQLEMER